ncbi:MAG: hypothetical protein M3N39_09230 [Pseudomonadota bacterium]|nr:hypothetical protein [Pseudomonadota bacterium]
MRQLEGRQNVCLGDFDSEALPELRGGEAQHINLPEREGMTINMLRLKPTKLGGSVAGNPDDHGPSNCRQRPLFPLLNCFKKLSHI